MRIQLRNFLYDGFNLVELLVVMAIIALLAALIFPLLGAISKHKTITIVRSELTKLENALSEYHGQYNAFPPSNPRNPMLSPLYYELSGVTNVGGTTGSYQTLDSASSVPLATYTSSAMFGVAGALNCTKTDPESKPAKNYLLGLSAYNIGMYSSAAGAVSNLVTSVGGSDQNYLNALLARGYVGNPFQYTCPGTNNPNSYDLWVDLQIGGHIYRIGNW